MQSTMSTSPTIPRRTASRSRASLTRCTRLCAPASCPVSCPAAAGCGRPHSPRSWACRARRLREALRRLATEGLVELEANRGATVAEHDFGDQRHSWLARVALEPGARGWRPSAAIPAASQRMREAIERPAGGRAADPCGELRRQPRLPPGAGGGVGQPPPAALRRDAVGAAARRADLRHAGRRPGSTCWPGRTITSGSPMRSQPATPSSAERLTRDHIQAFPPVER